MKAPANVRIVDGRGITITDRGDGRVDAAVGREGIGGLSWIQIQRKVREAIAES